LAGGRSAQVLVGIVIGSAICSGCGAGATGNGLSGSSTASGAVSEPVIQTVLPDGGEKMVFPMRSFSGMTKVASGAYAPVSALPFAADYPTSAGLPMGVFVSIPNAYPAGETEVVEEYDSSSTYRAFRVREEATPAGSLDQSFINQIPSICDTCTDARLVTLEPGVVGALLAGPNGPTSVTWLQGSFKMIVIGPAVTFPADTAVAVAKEVATGFNPVAAAKKKRAR
jgi:hypothetical protein